MRTVGPLLVGVICLLLLGPIAVVVIASFSGDEYLRFPPTAVSLQWYREFFGTPEWRAALLNSLVVALLCAIVATSSGFLSAYAILRGRPAWRNILMATALIPLIVPSIVTAISIYFLSVRIGLVGNRVWLAVAHAVIALPVVLIITQSALQAVDPALERAAMVHGCTRWGVFRRVVIPVTAPGIISASLFAFLASFDELVIALFVAGVRNETLPARIWNTLTMRLEPVIAAVSSVLIAMTVVILLVDAAIRARGRRSEPLV
jgi:ABC-type spermidine/putrescine transport system permease subunit II